MMRTLLFAFSCLFLLQVVSAGPGTHRYKEPHSNYGDEKKNKQHIQEHMKAMTKDDKSTETPELSEKDMIYYLFVIHDINGDGYLDGHELRAAFTDFDHEDGHTDEEKEELIPLDEANDMVDHVLLEDDKNGDGLISWSEYLESQLYHDD
ncbi:hypothetical protein INT48_006499 [Thamnidium elegans]|uniref:EF-hand domain-containing protein n=1 Tax=Thamnidium elegans TaxID=101142 RepID=A0A8H7W069_9FUNG|nr:hypothetical protein INT48_006499 [Thamnidium elegans]